MLVDRNGVYLFNLFKKKKDQDNLDYTDVNIDLMQKLNQSNKRDHNKSISYRLKNFFLPEKNNHKDEDITQVNLKSVPPKSVKKSKYEDLVTPDHFLNNKNNKQVDGKQDLGTIAQIPNLPEMTTTRTIATSELSNKLKNEEIINDKFDTMSAQGGQLLSKEIKDNKNTSVEKEEPRFPNFNPNQKARGKSNQVFDEDSKMHTDVHLLGEKKNKKSFWNKFINFKKKSNDFTRLDFKTPAEVYSDDKTLAGQDGETVLLKAPSQKAKTPKLRLVLIVILVALVASILFKKNKDELPVKEQEEKTEIKNIKKDAEKVVEKSSPKKDVKVAPVVKPEIVEDVVAVKNLEKNDSKEIIKNENLVKPIKEVIRDKKVPSKSIVKKISNPSNKISVVNIVYTKPGRGLVYNCVNKHWACVDEVNFQKCSDSTRSCKSFELYPSNKDCSTKQISNINQNLKITFCN